jgi:hypothetical protein
MPPAASRPRQAVFQNTVTRENAPVDEFSMGILRCIRARHRPQVGFSPPQRRILLCLKSPDDEFVKGDRWFRLLGMTDLSQSHSVADVRVWQPTVVHSRRWPLYPPTFFIALLSFV